MSPTEQFIYSLSEMKDGEKNRFRLAAGTRPDQSTEAFDLFTGIWWPLRQKYQNAPKRETAWVVCSLFSLFSVPHCEGKTIARQLAQLEPLSEREKNRYRVKVNEILNSTISSIPDRLRWALGLLSAHQKEIDWVRLTNDLSIWETGDTGSQREKISKIWLREYVESLKTETKKGHKNAD